MNFSGPSFLVFAKKLGLSLSTLRKNQPQLENIPYESECAFSGSLNASIDGSNQAVLYVKGSPEKILESSTTALLAGKIEPSDAASSQESFEQLASEGYPVLALAYRQRFHKDVVLSHREHIPDIDDRLVERMVPCMTVNDLCQRHGFQAVDIVQTDTEGHERPDQCPFSAAGLLPDRPDGRAARVVQE